MKATLLAVALCWARGSAAKVPSKTHEDVSSSSLSHLGRNDAEQDTDMQMPRRLMHKKSSSEMGKMKKRNSMMMMMMKKKSRSSRKSMSSKGKGKGKGKTIFQKTSVPSLAPTTSAAPSQTPSTPPDIIDSSGGFDCTANGGIGFNLNRSPSTYAYPQFVPLNATDPESQCALRLTADEAVEVAASAFLPFEFAPSNVEKLFQMSIGYRVYGDSAGSADGMAFVMHQDPRGDAALGGPGGNLGVYGAGGIVNALVVEWDTFENVAILDNGENNIHVTTVDSQGVVSELTETLGIPIRTQGTTSGRMWVDYCGGQQLEIYVNNTGDEKPSSPQTTALIDLDSFFGNNSSVTVGYTAGIFDEGDFHDITSWNFAQYCSAGGSGGIFARK